ncbi:MAG TPA: 50S ribosomal protein L15 [Ignavibacteria bacterium]|jgi:large subunit ribosomal protein L15
MDILSNLKYASGSRKKRKRIGRGAGSGHGKTSTRGHKGAGSRSGNKWHAWFEGGQMPLQRRLPKFGFNNPSRVEFQVLNLGKLQSFIDKGKIKPQNLNPETLFTCGIISSKKAPLKILGEGDFKAKLELSAHSFSKTAVEKIEKVGGKAITL